MAMRWKRGTYKIAINPQAYHSRGDSGVRQGYVSGSFGIAEKTWIVTHLPSGLRVYDRATKLREAKAAVEQLAPLLDWTQPNPVESGKMGEEVWMQVRKIVMGN